MAARSGKYTLITLSSFPVLQIFPARRHCRASSSRMPVWLHWASFKTFEASPFLASSIGSLFEILNAYTHRSILSVLRSVRSIGRHRRRLPVGRLGGTRWAFCLCPRISNTLKTHWRSHVLASSACLGLGMSDAAALVLDEIAPENTNRSPRPRVNPLHGGKE